MFTTNFLLLMPVIGLAAGLVAAMLVVRAQDARLAPAGFGTKTAPVLIPHYIKEGALVAMALPLAVLMLGSAGLMLAQYLTPPPPATVPVVIPWDPTKWPLPPPVDGVEPTTEPTTIVPIPPTGGGVPKPVEDSRAVTDDAGTQDDWAAQANAGAIDFDKLNKDSVLIVRNDIPDKGYIALERFPQLVKRVDPVYPSIAVSTGSQGRVCLQALLDIDGRVMRVEVSQSSGNPSLDDAAVDAVRQWVFTPAIAPGGTPTRVWQSCPIKFRLAN